MVELQALSVPCPDKISRWDFIISLDFDWVVLTGKKKFRWPMVSELFVIETRHVSTSNRRPSTLPGGI
jgi:hypothetical protein